MRRAWLWGALAVVLPCPAPAETSPVQASAPEAEAGQGAGAALRPLAFGQVFLGHGTHHTASEDFNAFELRRAEAGLGFAHAAGYAAMVNLEAVRSAGPQSLFGIDQDSLVVRVKHAFGQAEGALGPVAWQARAGLVPDVWVEAVETRFDLRSLTPVLAEAGGFFSASDLGVGGRARALDGALELRLGLTNGEGRNQRELNAGKNLTAALAVDPLRLAGLRHSRLHLNLGLRDGSVGPSSQADRRVMAAVTGRHRQWFGGGEWVRATGYGGRGDLEAQGLGGWLNGPVWGDWLGLALAWQRWTPDLAAGGASQRLLAGLYLDAWPAPAEDRPVLGFPRLRFSMHYEQWDAEDAAASVLGRPGADRVQSVWLTMAVQALTGEE